MKTYTCILSLFILTTSCLKDNPTLPTVITSPVTEVKWDDATAGGEVASDGGSPVIARGVCVTTSSTDPPTLDNQHTTDGSGLGSYTSNFYLEWPHSTPSVKLQHYFRAYATNINGTAYGEVLSFYPISRPPSADAIRLGIITPKATSADINYSIEPIPNYSRDEIGICYSTIPNPTSEGSHVLTVSTTLVTIDNLIPNTTYYVRGYVKNESGISYSTEKYFTTLELIEGTVTDIEGNSYEYKTIGTQVWMRNDLNTSKYNDGTTIPNVQDNIEWSLTNTNAYCTYTSVGKLYNFYVITDSRKLCPAGWHVPSDSDWKTLEIYLGMSQDQADATGLRGTDEGGKLKATTSVWDSPNTGATNSAGFSATGSGYREDSGTFTNTGTSAYYWSNSEYDAVSAWSRSLLNTSAQIGRRNIKKGNGFSVRCIKD